MGLREKGINGKIAISTLMKTKVEREKQKFVLWSVGEKMMENDGPIHTYIPYMVTHIPYMETYHKIQADEIVGLTL